MKKKVIKGLSVFVASAALCAGIATATACSGGNGTYEGEYSYTNEYGATYGMKVKVTVENNIITKVEDVTKGEYTIVSPGWETYFNANVDRMVWTTESENNDGTKVLSGDASLVDSEGNPAGDFVAGDKYIRYKDPTKEKNAVSYTEFVKWDGKTLPDADTTAVYSYSWSDAQSGKWTTYESKLLQQYEGWSVADILDIKVYIKETGEPYDASDNPSFNTSELLVSGATQSSGRLLLAIQDALGKKTEIGRIEK